MLGYEHHDSARSKMYPCAQFTGSLTDPNNVYAYKSPDNFYAPSMMATRGVNEMYVYGGSLGNANPLPSGPYVARVEPGSLKELWRTNLLNTHIGNQWIGAGSIESIDGDVLAIVNTYLFKIDGTTGAVKKVVSLPTIGSAPEDSYFNGMDGWSDGTLVMKNLARVPGCKEQGFFAVVNCPNLEKTPPSTMVVVDSKNLAVLASKQMEQMIGGRITAAEFNGKKYAYVAGPTKLYRYLWDGTNISLDTSWGPVSYLQPGETGASAASILGDQVLLMTNGGAPTQTPLSIVAISQSDPTKIHRIQPMPLQQGQISYIPSALSVDAVNNRPYTMDPGPGKVAAVDINPQTGEMKLAWSVDQSTLSWMVLIGPPDKRVLVATDIKTNTSMPNPLDWQSGPIGANYTERVQWREASTGKLLGQSDYYSPMVVGMQLWPGYGGLIYDGLTDGGLVAFQPLPSPPATPSPTPTPSPSPKG
ncbi:hypothetical protein NicSoilB8_25710 [Arthrobacter sp. NicSoilB8]|nr:hypothetical protein NicSoilB8_25710 [Arthrobacter sp. NicSoilB8]